MKYLMEQARVFLMLFIMLVMTAHDAIPHVHNDPSPKSHAHASSPLSTVHGHSHDHGHHHGTPEKKEDPPGDHLASQVLHSFLETHSGASHSHYYSSPLNKPFKKSSFELIVFPNASEPQYFDPGLKQPKPVFFTHSQQWEYCFLSGNSLRAPPFFA